MAIAYHRELRTLKLDNPAGTRAENKRRQLLALVYYYDDGDYC
jgi:hypothetical protein